MKRNLRILLKISFVLSLMLVWQAGAQAPADTGRVTEYDVNGLKVIVKRRPSSDTVAVGLFLRGGSQNITEANAGIEALLFSAASEGSAHFPRSEMNAALTGMGSSISFNANNDYSALALACTRAAFDRSWEIFVDAALHPLLLSADVEHDRAALIAGARARLETPEPLLAQIRRRTVFAGHPYRNDPDGTPESLARITADDLRAYHKQIMTRSRLLLVIVGDLDPAAIRPRIEAAFGALPAGETHMAATPLFAFDKPSVNVTERSQPSTYFQGVFGGPQFKSPDTDALAIAMAILQDRVFLAVRVKNALAYDPEASHSEFSASFGFVSASSVDPSRAAQLMLEEIGRLKSTPVAADDLSAVVAQFSTDYYVQIQTSASQAGRLALYEINGGGWRNSELRLDRLRAVTPGDVQRVAKQYMHDLQFVVLGDPKSVKKDIFTNQP
jgi:zinc protease